MRRTLAELEQAKQARDRARELQRRQLIPQQALDDAETTLPTRQAQYDVALQNARNMRADIDASRAAARLADVSCATRSSARSSMAISRSGWSPTASWSARRCRS